MSEWVEYITFKGLSPMAQLREANGSEEAWDVKFWGVGNENWGCGGNMNPEYYANEYRRYQTYIRDYRNDGGIKKICCGPNADDYTWTRTVLDTCFRSSAPEHHGFMDDLSLHYYTVPGDGKEKGSAVFFNEKDWYRTLSKTLYMEELIERHGQIMDEYDPDKKIGLIIDEWGTWYDCEPGTNPGFLYQQNTMRDALVAGINLNLFNKHCDRVKMANLAQMVNVLQAVLLTEGERMIKTPTYHVFQMYKCHQGASLVESTLEISRIGLEEAFMVPNLTHSVSVDDIGQVHITITNLSADEASEIEAEIMEREVKEVKGELLAGDIHAKNTFEEPTKVQPVPFHNIILDNGAFKFTLPPCSVAHLAVK